MIYDMRTYTLTIASVPTVEKLFEEALPVREKYSRLGAFFHTETGVINEIIHIWPYDDLAHLERVRAEAAADPSGMWPPKGLSEYVVTMESELLLSLSFMEDWTEPKVLGNIYELRTYSLLPGHTPDVVKTWTEKIPGRLEFSPIAGCWIPLGTGGTMNRLYHLWPYEDFAARSKARSASTASGKWPPDKGQHYTRQESKILIPASFSPMH
jgi:hypothetical protein